MLQLQKSIPSAVVKRLTRYFSLAHDLREQGRKWISSADLAKMLGLTSSTVRQDLSHLEFSGISKRGYNTKGLQEALSHVLGADTPWKMIIVGAGNLGRALALHNEFARWGFHTCALFDSDGKKVGRKVGKLKVRDMRELPDVVAADRVDIGVIAVPAPAAQRVADILVMSGVNGLLNLALAHVVSPRNVAVVDSRVVANLLELSHAIRMQRLLSRPRRGRKARQSLIA